MEIVSVSARVCDWEVEEDCEGESEAEPVLELVFDSLAETVSVAVVDPECVSDEVSVAVAE